MNTLSTNKTKTDAQIAARLKRLPQPTFPEDLPVSGRREEIAAAIANNQVTIVCGETGSGKTTQLPKICLELKRGVHGLIGHTQPRRLAARTTAARIAQELQSGPGASVDNIVGYKIRFHDHTSPDSFIKLMTDGILLAETQSDPLLSAYDTLIIDEAHERSLNIDFLLGYLKTLLPRRPDLKLIVTSATLDAERFAQHFGTPEKLAPVIQVSGRTYPVEMRYRPIETEDDSERENERDLYAAIVDACDELGRESRADILVFLPGEREIRDAADALRKSAPLGTEILPLFARLTAQDQDRIFKPDGGRRIVLSTNVAETSLTVPGIRYVVDSGLARVRRYSFRNKVEQLQVEKISQAAANQRAGRCGRLGPGICIRLFDETDFSGRPAYTQPEILRSSLAGVILRMHGLHFGDVEAFPFLEAPQPKMITDGYQLLTELGALDETRHLTTIGSELAQLPLDPRVARMLLEARRRHCLAEMLIIASILSIQDPRERPMDRQTAADAAQKKFSDEKSDFLSFIKLWNFYAEAVSENLTRRKLAALCHSHFLSANRMREWRDIHAQLEARVLELGWRLNDKPADYADLHKALLAGLVGNVGSKNEEDGQYMGAHGIRFQIHPGSGLYKKAGKWIVAAELTETRALYARCVARIEPLWIEEVCPDLVKRHHDEPHWEKTPAQVVAFERGTLYGLMLYSRRRIAFGLQNPVLARELFIRGALVEGELPDNFAKAPFFQHNQKLMRDIEQLEHKSRRPDVLVDDTLIFGFYDQLIPQAIYNAAAFESWRKEAERENPRLLYLNRDDLMRHEAAGITTDLFPNKLTIGGNTYALAYHFEPGSPRDGVTLTLPLILLNQFPAARADWLVPGLLKEKVQQLCKSLPGRMRNPLVPLPEFAARFADAFAPGTQNELTLREPLIPALKAYIRREHQVDIPLDSFRPENLPAHLAMNFKIIDEHTRQLGMSRNLAELRREFGNEAEQHFGTLEGARAAAESGATTAWNFGNLADMMEITHNGQTLVGYPAIIDDGKTVHLDVIDSPERAAVLHRKGLRRLFMLNLPEQVKYLEKGLPGINQLAMQYMNFGDPAQLRAQVVEASFDRACMGMPLPKTEREFAQRLTEGKGRLNLIAQEIVRLVGTVLTEYQNAEKKVGGAKAFAVVVTDVRSQLDRLMHKQFVATPFERLQHYPRYLKGIALRLDKLRTDPARDTRQMNEMTPVFTNWSRELSQLRKHGADTTHLEDFGWLLEELRVALFAQELKTPAPVSVKRLQKIWDSLKR